MLLLAVSEPKPGETPVAHQFSGTSYSANGIVQEAPYWYSQGRQRLSHSKIDNAP
jgi:hypothetical protein